MRGLGCDFVSGDFAQCADGGVVGGVFDLCDVMGEYVFAALLDRPAFGPFMVWAGGKKAYEPAALAVMTFALTWACMALIQLAARFSKHTRTTR